VSRPPRTDQNRTDQSRTEQPHPAHTDLDLYTTDALVAALAKDQALAAQAVLAAATALAQAVDAAAAQLAAGGRLVTVGAGTSGRLGLLDSVELGPTFSWPRERTLALLAGGPGAVFEAVEGAEDDAAQGIADLAAAGVGAADVVLAIAASGATPYTVAAARAARSAGALTIGMANNPGAPLLAVCEIGVLLDTGPEVISGSTRLKAGTAQKIALNTFSSALMVRLHKVHGNLMVDLRATNAKLRDRALRLTVVATGADEARARAALATSGGQVKTAVVMLLAGADSGAAARALDAAHGSVRRAVADLATVRQRTDPGAAPP
jgi:N-acetylmuramic acid 6-phosphate etherase